MGRAAIKQEVYAMIQEIELLNQIHQNADMGRDSIRHIIKLSDDAEFLHALNTQLDGYEKAYDTSNGLLHKLNAQPEDASPVAKTMSRITSTMKSMVNPTTSKLAEMMIEGGIMGITNLTKQINAYSGSRQDILNLAEQELHREEKYLEEMKKYL